MATISFGQRFEVTPLQMITMVSTIANKGVYVRPRIVKKIIDSQTGKVTEMKSIYGQRAISEETATKVLSMMNSVVAEGTGKNAKVVGYQVGGKTGTSEDGVNTGKYVTSFIGVANTDEPEVAILVTLYNPTGEGGHQGGSVAAPVAGSILSEVLPYLELKKQEEEKNEIVMENLKELTVKEVKEKLKYFQIELVGENINNDSKIYKQIPEEGVKINIGAKIILYAE